MRHNLHLNPKLAAPAIALLLYIAGMNAAAQTTLTLEECYRSAEAAYPLKSQPELMQEASDLRIANLKKAYLPQVNVNGNASLQSDVTEVAIELPKGLPELQMPKISKDWYKLTLDVNQAIYDGNVTSYQKRVESFNLQADRKGVEVEMYKLKDRVNQLFFSILLLEQNERLIMSSRERIASRLKETESAIRNGAMPEMNGDMLRAELIRIDQQLGELALDRATAFRMLSELTGLAIAPGTRLASPEVAMPSEAYENRRPEYELFNIQRNRVDLMKNMVTTKWNPKVYAYGQAGYGRPGLNMLDNAFRPWWLFGAKVTWNPWNWNGNKNEKKILALQGDILKSQQETFDKNLRISAQKELSEVTKAAGLLERDQEIINLREKITRAASSQLDNGVIMASDYIARLNEETTARLNLELHRIQLLKAKLNYLYTLGKL